MISIDTEILRQLVLACSAANDSINEAVDVLNRVTTHNDWNCKERDSINEYTNQNKTRIRALQEKSRGFLNALALVSHDFENAETSISDMFASLESLLGSLIAIPTVGGALNTGAWGHVPNNITDANTWPPMAATSHITSIINDVINPASGNNEVGIHFEHNHYGEIDGVPLYRTSAYDPDGNMLWTTMTAPLEKYEANNITAMPTVCNFEDLSFGGGD